MRFALVKCSPPAGYSSTREVSLICSGVCYCCRCFDVTAQRALIENGYVFIACPPLFKIKQGKTEKYVYTQVRPKGRIVVSPKPPPCMLCRRRQSKSRRYP